MTLCPLHEASRGDNPPRERKASVRIMTLQFATVISSVKNSRRTSIPFRSSRANTSTGAGRPGLSR